MLSVRILREKDFKCVVKLDSTLKGMQDIVIRNTEEEIIRCLESGLSVGLFDKERLVAFSLCYSDSYNYACYVEKCFTVTEYRGKGLQSKTIGLVLDKARESGNLVAVAFVSPKNTISLNNFIRSGFKDLGVRGELFGIGVKRNLLVCELS